MKTKPYLTLLLVAWLLATNAGCAVEESKLFRNLTFDAAFALAAAQNKLVFVDFYTT